jgi:hypothetical protein
MKLDEGIVSAAHLRQLDGDRHLSFVQRQTIKHLNRSNILSLKRFGVE